MPAHNYDSADLKMMAFSSFANSRNHYFPTEEEDVLEAGNPILSSLQASKPHKLSDSSEGWEESPNRNEEDDGGGELPYLFPRAASTYQNMQKIPSLYVTAYLGGDDAAAAHTLSEVNYTTIDPFADDESSVSIAVPALNERLSVIPARSPSRSAYRSQFEFLRDHLYDYLSVQGYVSNLLPLLYNQDNRSVSSRYERHALLSTSDANTHNADPPHEMLSYRRNRIFFSSGSLRSSMFNLTTATVGAGILSLPFAFSNSGLILCSSFLVLFGLTSLWATSLLVEVMTLCDAKTYEEMAVKSLGRRFAVIVELCIVMFCFGTAVAYLISLGDVIDMVLLISELDFSGNWWAFLFLSRNTLSVWVTLLVLLPLCLTDKIGKLRFASFIGVVAVGILAFTVLMCLFEQGVQYPFKSFFLPQKVSSSVRALTLVVFSFTCHPNVPAIYNEMERASPKRMTKAARRSVLICFTAYALVGVCGYLSFYQNTTPNILNNFNGETSSRWHIVAALVGIFIAVIFAYPMNIFPCRYSLEVLLMVETNNQTTSGVYGIIISVMTVLFSLILALAIPQISLIFELIASTAGAMISFILPGFFYIKLLPGNVLQRRNWRALTLMSVGCFVAIFGVIQSLQDLFSAYWATDIV